jgi:hypothetical protein
MELTLNKFCQVKNFVHTVKYFQLSTVTRIATARHLYNSAGDSLWKRELQPLIVTFFIFKHTDTVPNSLCTSACFEN